MYVVPKLPWEFVDYLTKPGLGTNGGDVPLNQYMCKSKSNGGNDNTHNLMKRLRKMQDNGSGPTLSSILGTSRLGILIKGQGHPDDFVTTWNFMCRNKDQLRDIEMDVVDRRQRNNTNEMGKVLKSGNIHDMYFKNRADSAALKMMVQDRFFGLDCIGFVANYLQYVDIWSKYHGASISQWGTHVFKINVRKVEDVKALDLLLWGGHVALVDWVWGEVDKKTIRIDVCQSSSGGPQCNEFVNLTQLSEERNGRRVFKVSGGTPKLPVDGRCVVMRRKGITIFDSSDY